MISPFVFFDAKIRARFQRSRAFIDKLSGASRPVKASYAPFENNSTIANLMLPRL
jgi:hypothetical protein